MMGVACATYPMPSASSPSHTAEIRASELTTAKRREVRTYLEKRVQACVDSQDRIEGQAQRIKMSVRFTEAGDDLLVNFGPGFVPKEATLGFKVQLAEVVELIFWYMQDIAQIDGPVYTFNGTEISTHFPGADVYDFVRDHFDNQNPCRQRLDEGE
jgi:hypothetical protein